MLRLLVLALILVNGVYYAWTSGSLRAYGFAPAQQREPQRLAQQIQPGAIRLLSPAEFKQAEALMRAEQVPKECLQAGPFTDEQLDPLRQALEEALPAGAWQLNPTVVPARWILYMGKYPNADALAKKRAELEGLHLKPEALTNPSLEPGLSLGGFGSEAAATGELTRLTQRGIRTAKVVKEHDERKATVLKLPALTEALKPKLGDLKTALAGKGFKSCN